MATTANSKSSFLKRLEITQTASHKSQCTLESTFLTKPENYTLQLEHFLVDITPSLNLIEGPYFEVLRRPAYTDTVPEDEDELLTLDDMPVLGNKDFLPVNPKTVLDVISQLHTFCQLHDGLSIQIEADMSIRFQITRAWGDAHYLKLSQWFATLMELPEYIYAFNRRNQTDEDWDDEDDIEYVVSAIGVENELFYTFGVEDRLFDDIKEAYYLAHPYVDGTTVFAWSDQPPAGSLRIASEQTLRSLDQRLSFEVTCTFSSDSKIDIVNQDTTKKRIIGRFPIGDMIETYSDFSSVSEYVNVGIEDLTRSNPNTQTLNLHNGEILIVNTLVEVRYLVGTEIRTVAADFGASGFFSMMLLFSKRIK